MRAPSLSQGARLTFAILASHADYENDACHPGLETLAEDVGRNEKVVRGYLRELEARELVERTRRGNKLTNLYVVRSDRVSAPAIAGVALGPWKECVQHDDLMIVPSREQVEKFLELADKPPARDSSRGVSAGDILAHAHKAAQREREALR